MDVTDTAAIVTGGASGLGAAVARELAARGSRVFALDLEQAVRDAAGVEGVTPVVADVTDQAQVAAAVERAAGSGVPLRVVVNCAGIGPSARTVGKSGPHDLGVFRKVVEINLIGTFTVLSLAAAAIARTEPDGNASAVWWSTRRPSPPSRARSGRSPTRRRRAGWWG